MNRRTKATVIPIDPSTYKNHFTHGEERTWSESNCYVDLWTELLNGLGLDPVACMPFTLDLDFEGDQWTFFKYPLEDIRQIYGLDVNELNVWQPHRLVHHCIEQAAMGRSTIVEIDAHYLPDTSGTTYHTGHEKTSIAIVDLDVEAKRCVYFHAKSAYLLSGDDFAGAFRLDLPADAVNLPPYVETVRMHAMKKLGAHELAKESIALLRQHLARRPNDPFARFRGRFMEDVEWLKNEDLGVFHGYAFACLRQIGASYELASTYMKWLEERGEKGLLPIAEKLEQISTSAKSVQFNLARVVRAKKKADFAPMLDTMQAAWGSAMNDLVARYG